MCLLSQPEISRCASSIAKLYIKQKLEIRGSSKRDDKISKNPQNVSAKNSSHDDDKTGRNSPKGLLCPDILFPNLASQTPQQGFRALFGEPTNQAQHLAHGSTEGTETQSRVALWATGTAAAAIDYS
jgi:hypothetical protein